jgi:hypothetical protein
MTWQSPARIAFTQLRLLSRFSLFGIGHHGLRRFGEQQDACFRYRQVQRPSTRDNRARGRADHRSSHAVLSRCTQTTVCRLATGNIIRATRQSHPRRLPAYDCGRCNDVAVFAKIAATPDFRRRLPSAPEFRGRFHSSTHLPRCGAGTPHGPGDLHEAWRAGPFSAH